jgi:hypothetical protein
LGLCRKTSESSSSEVLLDRLLLLLPNILLGIRIVDLLWRTRLLSAKPILLITKWVCLPKLLGWLLRMLLELVLLLLELRLLLLELTCLLLLILREWWLWLGLT